MIRVLIADDHALVRGGLRHLLAPLTDMVVVDEVGSGAEVVQAVAKHRPDVVTLDISMPATSFLEVLTQLREQQPAVRVLVVSFHAEAIYARRAIRAGAAGYITKDRADTELVAAIRMIASGRRYVSAAFAEDLAADLVEGRQEASHRSLTNREYEILLLLAAGHTVTHIGDKLALSVKTVSTHRTRLLHKMELSSNADIVRYALTHKLIE
jgi:DNA-binding NarL/FixJ family response regulator